jgi:hypothetical protein
VLFCGYAQDIFRSSESPKSGRNYYLMLTQTEHNYKHNYASKYNWVEKGCVWLNWVTYYLGIWMADSIEFISTEMDLAPMINDSVFLIN